MMPEQCLHPFGEPRCRGLLKIKGSERSSGGKVSCLNVFNSISHVFYFRTGISSLKTVGGAQVSAAHDCTGARKQTVGRCWTSSSRTAADPFALQMLA